MNSISTMKYCRHTLSKAMSRCCRIILSKQQQDAIYNATLPQYSEQPAGGYDGALYLSWMLGSGKHPMVTDDEVSYIMDCLKCINNSVVTDGLEQMATAAGLLFPEDTENLDPENVVRQALEQMLQTKSRNGTDDIFVMPGGAFSTGYKKKVPLHVVVGSAPLGPDEMDVDPTQPSMTVLWDWNVRLECVTHEEA